MNQIHTHVKLSITLVFNKSKCALWKRSIHDEKGRATGLLLAKCALKMIYEVLKCLLNLSGNKYMEA